MASFLLAYLGYFLALIFLGSLCLHFSEGAAHPYLLSLFTSTSAACQTGLVIIDTAGLQPLSQAILVLLMLAGGNVLLSAVPVALRMWRLRAIAPPEATEYLALRYLTFIIILYWASIQGVAFFFYALYAQWDPRLASLLAARNVNAWQFAALLSTSSFSNASYVPFSDNMVGLCSFPPILLVSAAQVLLGNCAYPLALRASVWLLARAHPTSAPLAFLLEHPRRCCTHLFRLGVTLQLGAWLAVLTLADFAIVLGSDFQRPYLSSYDGATRALLVFYQAISTRAAGFNVYSIASVAPAGQVMYGLSMYLSTMPQQLETASGGRQLLEPPTAEKERAHSGEEAADAAASGAFAGSSSSGGSGGGDSSSAAPGAAASPARASKSLRLRTPTPSASGGFRMAGSSGAARNALAAALEESTIEAQAYQASWRLGLGAWGGGAGSGSGGCGGGGGGGRWASTPQGGEAGCWAAGAVWGHLVNPLSGDLFLLFLALLAICMLDRDLLEGPGGVGGGAAAAAAAAGAQGGGVSIFSVLFELGSAIGNVGLTLADGPVCLSALLSPASQVIVMLLMLRGRHRGVPLSIAQPLWAASADAALAPAPGGGVPAAVGLDFRALSPARAQPGAVGRLSEMELELSPLKYNGDEVLGGEEE
jgi:Trk-type K+ transport system membrane component